MAKTTIDINHLSKLSQLHLDPTQTPTLTQQLQDTLKTISSLDKINTPGAEPTSQVTGLTNITRPDVIEPNRILSLDQALSNAKKTHNGYFVVPAILE